MMGLPRLTRARFLVGSLLAAGAGALPLPSRARDETALDRYVAKPDPHYWYELVDTIEDPRYIGYVLEMTSQRWRGFDEVDRPIWKHWLTVVVPRRVTTTVGAVIVGGGSNHDDRPHDIDPLLALLALSTESVVADLRMVPNQPLTFADDGRGRSEDDLIAYTWAKFLRTQDEQWPLRLPMTKSVVRAFDTVTSFCRRPEVGRIAVDRYIVGGASKRGWTVWTTAAADERVVGAIPIVIDVLNVEASIEHEYRAYGTWAPSLRPYVEMGVVKWMGTRQMDALMEIEDPFSYRHRLTMPKLIINATGDQFFVPDSSRFYFHALPGEKFLRYVPNTDHSLKGAEADAAKDVLAFYRSIVGDLSRPSFTWRFEDDGSIRVETITKPSVVKLWQATNPKARDFRLATIGRAFASTELDDAGDGVYVGNVPKPERGWRAYFLELTYRNGKDYPFTFTTDVRVSPDLLPYRSPGERRPRGRHSG
jgi:PhoPQ-activated pathogenicity-related protein